MTPAAPLRLRLAFMGTPAFAVPSLEALLDAGHEVAAVYTQPPRPAGRGNKTTQSPVHQVAAGRGLEVRTPARLRDPAEHAAFAALGLDAAVVVAYGLILPRPILAAPRLGCLNVHASLLPRWRGAAPIQRAILAGDPETGVSIMRMDEGLDTGPVLATDHVAIGPRSTSATLHEELSVRGARLLVGTLAAFARGEIEPAPQPATGVAYAPKVTREEGRLDWTKPAAALERQVRAFAPWPGAWFETGGERIKVLAAAAEEGSSGAAPGTVLDAAPSVACGGGGLRLLRLQREGKAPLDAAAFLRGHPLGPGTQLGG
jgi:methionyl-tRNA formyltransferase